MLCLSVHRCAPICVAVIYRPPSSSVQFFDAVTEVLCELNIVTFSNFIFVGDFNIDYNNSNCSYFCKLQCILSSFVLSQMVESVTRSSSNSLLDLVLVSNPTGVNCSLLSPLANSDCSGLLVSYSIFQHACSSSSVSRLVWDYKKANFLKACVMLDCFDCMGFCF